MAGFFIGFCVVGAEGASHLEKFGGFHIVSFVEMKWWD
jgi:hypothetical protein